MGARNLCGTAILAPAPLGANLGVVGKQGSGADRRPRGAPDRNLTPRGLSEKTGRLVPRLKPLCWDAVKRRGLSWRVRPACLAAAIGVLAAPVPVALAQDEVSTQLWLDYNPRWTWPSGVELHAQLGVRSELEQTGWWRFVVVPGARGPVGPFRLSGGIGSWYTANELSSDRWEIRPFQGIAATWPSSPIHLDHRLQLEERFEFETADWSLNASFRIRYKLQPVFRWGGITGEAFWQLLLHIEGFLTVAGDASQFDERVRVGVGVERGFGSAWQLRADVTWQKVGTIVSGAPTDEVYLRVRAFHAWW